MARRTLSSFFPSKPWRIGVLASLFVLAIAVTNCTSQNASSPDVKGSTSSAGVLIYGSGGQPVNLEAGNVTDGNSLVVHNQIYNRLIEFKPGTTELDPSLATGWAASPDGKTYTFKLRSGIKFHDGTDFNAEAVTFNFDRWWDKNDPNGFRNAGKTYEIWGQIFGGYKGEPTSLIQDIKAVDGSTVQFVLKQPFAAFPSAIASSYFSIASPTAIRKAGATYGTPAGGAVGTGGFVFKEWRSGDRIVLEKNPDYWKAGLPKTNQLVMRFVSDASARLAQLRAGQLDFTVDLAPDQKAEIERDTALSAISRPSFNVGYLALNPSYKPFADVRIRHAIAHAINQQAIVQAFWQGAAVNDAHFVPQTFDWAKGANLPAYEFNPPKAKDLLTQAGYPNGFDLDLWYMPVSRPYFPTPKPIAEAFAADLSAVGIRVNLKTKDWASYLSDRIKPPGYQAFMMGWIGDYGDPDTFYYPHFGPDGTNDIGKWKNEQVLQLLEQARTASAQSDRGKLYAQVDEIIHREAVRLPIVHAEPLLAQRKSLEGWIPSPLGSEPFEAIAKR
ncbi:ABC transporter substrate-binding protein [Myxacorys almedinensis]|uniref:ABC transporter substrate-binding protein n=1 Tax=Myxacorys almedinensis A TaxID=2690445 RepID=A0A8J7Z3Q3_9CYAN|nr:ABC transporter substrate-binding protein [Myxacorys almedinensis]NDJ17626.1 ABC transporter substrate-binding protein [Myxacorys almedinensis A]